MFLLTYQYNHVTDWGFAEPEKGAVHPAKTIFGAEAPRTLLEYIQNRVFYDFPDRPVSPGPIPLDAVTLMAPIPRPLRNILCVGRNYLEHIRELNRESLQPEYIYPNFFTKATNTVIGPYDTIPLHEEITQQVDYEVELAVIIGTTGADIPEETAMDYVFGYTILNDVTARDVQKNHFQWFKGKSLDGFCPMGPWIVTRDEFSEPDALNLKSFVNNELRQEGNTRQMIFPIPKLISILSQGFTLEAGDIIATGTPAGVGMGFDPPRLLRKGDTVRMEIEGIGLIENKVW